MGSNLDQMNHTFENIEPSGNYCVKAIVIYQPAKEAMRCIETPGSQAEDVWRPFVVASLILVGFLLLGAAGHAASKHPVHVETPAIVLPQSLIFLNTNLSAMRAALPSDETSIASLSAVCCSHHGLLKDQEGPQIQFVSSGFNTQQQNAYHANDVPWDALSDEDSTVWSGTLGDTLSSIESMVEEEDVTKGSSRTAPEPLEPSILPSPSKGGRHRHAMGTGACPLACEIGSKTGQVRGSPLSARTGIPLDSLKLQDLWGLQGLLPEPGSPYLPGEDSDAYSEAQVEHTTESLPRQEPCAKDSGGPCCPYLEGRDDKTRRFPGYELRPAILF